MKKVLNGVFLQMLIPNNSLDMNVETFCNERQCNITCQLELRRSMHNCISTSGQCKHAMDIEIIINIK